MLSYYSDNTELLFRLKSSEFNQQITLTELEDMLPYERTIYFMIIHNKIKEHDKLKKK